MMQTLCTLRRWLRGLEPQVRTSWNAARWPAFSPGWNGALFGFQRQPWRRAWRGMFCGSSRAIADSRHLAGVCLAARQHRGRGRGHVLYQPLTTVPLYALVFIWGHWSCRVSRPCLLEFGGPGVGFSVQALATWVQALGTPLLVGLPALAA